MVATMKYKTRRLQPTKVSFKTKDNKIRTFNATRIEFPIIELKGEPIESFDRVSKIIEIILLGNDGEIRRIILK